MNILSSFILLPAISIVLVSCSHEMSSQYLDKGEAMKKGGLVEKGWMPEEIPDTARDISESHDLDVNTGTGSFTYDTNELADYRDKMKGFSLPEDQVKKMPWLGERKGAWEFFQLKDFLIGIEAKTGEGFWSVGSNKIDVR